MYSMVIEYIWREYIYSFVFCQEKNHFFLLNLDFMTILKM